MRLVGWVVCRDARSVKRAQAVELIETGRRPCSIVNGKIGAGRAADETYWIAMTASLVMRR